MSDGGDDFGREYESNSHRAHLAAYVLIAGLVLELVNAIIWYRGPETIAEMVAVLLIVGGVWGEVFFGNKARMAGDKQLAQYEARVAESNARAEEANQKAQEAALQLARLTTPREIAGEHLADLVDAISPFPGTPFILLMQPEPEPMALMNQLSDALLAAEWNWLGTGQPIAFTRPGKPPVGMMTGTGVVLQVAESRLAELEAAMLALGNALDAAGIEGVACHQMPDDVVPPTAIHIRIGRKP
jgi:hypothetical protein